MSEVRKEFVEIAHPRNGNIRRGWNFVGTIHGIQLTRKITNLIFKPQDGSS